MAAKTILYSAIKPDTLEFGEPVRDNQGITVPVQYEGRRLQFQLPKLRCAPSPPSGRSPAARRAAPGEPPTHRSAFGSGSPRRNCYVNRWKDGPPSLRCLLPGYQDEGSAQKKLFEILGEIDKQVLEAAKKHKDKWFSGKKHTNEFLDGAFNALVKEGKLNEERGTIGAPSFKAGISVRKATGEVLLPICDETGKAIDFADFELKHKGMNCTLICELGDVWFMPGMFGVSVRCRMLKCEQRADAIGFDSFLVDESEEAEPAAKKARTGPSDEELAAAAAFM